MLLTLISQVALHIAGSEPAKGVLRNPRRTETDRKHQQQHQRGARSLTLARNSDSDRRPLGAVVDTIDAAAAAVAAWCCIGGGVGPPPVARVGRPCLEHRRRGQRSRQPGGWWWWLSTADWHRHHHHLLLLRLGCEERSIDRSISNHID